MNVFVTAGNTQTPIDRVRCITNIFSGRTGTQIALAAHDRGHAVTLATSQPDIVRDLAAERLLPESTWRLRPYRTFDDLHRLMADAIPGGGFDAVIHCAAVSDFAVEGVYVPGAGTTFDTATAQWHGAGQLANIAANKVKSRHREVWLRLVSTPKLVDSIRSPWGFRGVLVKFKLEVGVDDVELSVIAERSRERSDADIIVANTLEEMHELAFLCPRNGAPQRLRRSDLPTELLRAVEAIR